MTHELLRKRAIQWLTNSQHCAVVLSEISTAACEIPDAIGWHGRLSVSVECKVSRSDFLAQRKKCHIRAERGVGQLRYYLCPKGLLSPSDIEGTDYGLLEWNGEKHSGVREIVKAPGRDSCRDDEITMLVSALRRVRAREFLILVQPTVEEAED